MAKISNKKKNERKSRAVKQKFVCPNCGEMISFGHFVGPSLREVGFYLCRAKKKLKIG